MTITAKVVADSINTCGDRLITLELEYPRFIHSEFMTHRVFSRNAASSRAIPVPKMLERVKADPAMPVHWGRNKPGMQAEEELSPEMMEQCKADWLEARDKAVSVVEKMLEYKPHKQVVNRLLEPFLHIRTLVTATDYRNFFLLRDHPDAQPEIRALAVAMREAINESYPVTRRHNEWHYPYIGESESGLSHKDKLKVSAARCARVSYLYHDGKPTDLQKDIELHDRLLMNHPIHASPAEHQAVALDESERFNNFTGWVQYRWYLENGN